MIDGGNSLIALALLVPLLLLLATMVPRLRVWLPALLPLAPLPAMAAAFWAPRGPVWVLGNDNFALTFRIDGAGALLLGVAALLWSMAGLYARTWLKTQANPAMFLVSWAMTLLGCLGVYLAADLIDFYFLLAVLSVGTTGLVLAGGGEAAVRIGGLYLMLALFAEALLLVGLVLLAEAIPGDSLLIADAAAALPLSPTRDLTLLMLIAGLGMKAGLVPLHFWMPLAHSTAPVPASAVLSGAVVKASILALVRFLPLTVPLPQFGLPLAAIGLGSALYAAAIGITQGKPKVILAYSSVSQIGVMVAIIGMGLAAGDGGTGIATIFYAAHHLLVKGGLFLCVGLVAATGARHLRPILMPAAILGIGLGGLPLTGGALAKYATKPLMGDGLASIIATISSAATAMLMLHFARVLAKSHAADADARPPQGLLLPVAVMLVAALLAPYGLYALIPLGSLPKALAPAVLWDGLWPVLIGIAAGLLIDRLRLPAVPPGDIGVAVFRLGSPAARLGDAVVGLDAVARRWVVACFSLLLLALAFGATLIERGPS